MTAQLPPGFEDFEPFIDSALPTQSARSARKYASTMEEITALYQLGIQNERLQSALLYCDQFPFSELPEEARRLLHITLAMAEVRPQVELYGEVRPSSAGDPTRLVPTAATDVR